MSDQNLSRTNRTHPKNKKAHHPLKKRILYITASVIGVIAILVISLAAYWSFTAPKVTNAGLVGSSQSTILDKDGNTVWTSGNERREIARQSEYPSNMKNAVVAIEDRRFYKHGGVDLRRIIGAAFANLTGSSLGLQGGSTLTQQLIKQTAFSSATSDQTIKRKIQEAWMSIKVEKQYSKAQILTLYMNKVYMGNGVYGMKTAAKFYFNKNMDELSIPQTALIAGLPQSPSGYDPYANPSGAKYRRDQVLDAMAAYGTISKSDAATYKATAIDDGLVSEHPEKDVEAENEKISDAYISSVLAQVKKQKYDINRDGLTIKTNLDSDVQNKAYDIINSSTSNTYGIAYPDDELQAAVTITDPKTGDVIAQIGGRNQDSLQGLNLATSTQRSGGSTVKPLIDYAPAIEAFNWPTYRAVDDSASFKYAGTNLYVGDAGMTNNAPYSKQSGQSYVTMRNALSRSLNVPALHTLEGQSTLPSGEKDEYVGYKRAGKFLNKLGIDQKLTGGSAIGFNVSTEQEAAAFAAFANGGTYYKPSYIKTVTTREGKVENMTSTGSKAMKESTAFMVNSMLQSVFTAKAPWNLGFNKYVHSDYTQGAKSGTVAYPSSSKLAGNTAQDLWFTGFTKSASISVWTGYDQPMDVTTPLSATSQLPSEIYDSLMQYVMDKNGSDGSDWSVPSSVSKVNKYGQTEYEVDGADFNDPFANRVAGSTTAVSGSASSSIAQSSTIYTTTTRTTTTQQTTTPATTSSNRNATTSTVTSNNNVKEP
ncbi:carboxypeptidase [Weissella coleopterorum]|uniref:Carboxypeptidase n=1 Tax=Weissella coleopterorum TaxID=2714949 RepID=A0A6G8B0V1_9LACO|nr:transglycosylase domain-containing protein [Weissella coleopterorum]QIL50867.1 carboxypeptidase [Weissella coleopterorum]